MRLTSLAFVLLLGLLSTALSQERVILLAQAGGTDGRLAPAGTGRIAILVPEVGEPYRGVFEAIVEGAMTQAGGRATRIPVRAETDSAGLARTLREQNVRVVIALGKNGLKAAAGLDGGFQVVAGAVLSVEPDEARDNTVVSLAPDPALLFARLKALRPDVRRISVVYSPRMNDWLIRLAREAATAQGIALNALPAADLKEALRQYQGFFAACSAADALWLTQDSTVEESAILPLVLKETWDRRMPLFSSSLAHVRRGALFSLYPDNHGLGKGLADAALAYADGRAPPQKGVRPLREVLTAVNTRTAGHLGIELRRQGIDLLLPEF